MSAAPVPTLPTIAPDPDAALLADAEQTLAKLSNQLPTTTNDRQLAAMSAEAAKVQTTAARRAAAAQAQLASVAAELRRTPVRHHPKPAEEAKRNALLAQQRELTTRQAQMRATAARAGDVFNKIAERRREGFSARVLERTASPLEPEFWTSLAHETGADFKRLGWLAAEVQAAARAAAEPRGLAGLGLGVAIAVLLVWPVRNLLGRVGSRRAQTLDPPRTRRTLVVFWRVIVDIAAPTLAAMAVWLGARWGGLLEPVAEQLAAGAVGSIAWAASVLALGRALGTSRDPTARLVRMSDEEARRARLALWAVALITAGGFFLQRLNYVVGASVAATIAANSSVALAYAGAAILILVTVGGRDAGAPEARGRAAVWTLISLVLAVGAVVIIGAVIAGYTTLAALLAGQLFWVSVLAAEAFLLVRVVDEEIGALFRPNGRLDHMMRRLFGFHPSTVAQLGLLLSALVQLVVLIFALVLAVTPFGGSGQLLMGHLRGLGTDIHIGKVTVSPMALVGGLATFILGVGLSHLVRMWVERRYLPVTRWDVGVRNSVSTGVAYIGFAIALLSALAVVGVSLQQIALVASALSVGIGFGLQQIVQNFVAGVILLIERPVKVGDWVAVAGVEGDVQDIRVRATDIRNLDGSTVIVPNSSLITTNVENKTLRGTQSRLQLAVTVTKAADVGRARDLILQLAEARSDVLQEPKPQVYIDALTAGGGATLKIWLYVNEPRAGTRIKSEIYFALLEAFQKNAIAM